MLKQEPLAPHTTIQLGGPAAYYSVCTSDEEIIIALQFAADQKVPVHILGGGSNTIFSDGGFTGLIVEIALPGLDINPDTGLVSAAAGIEWDDLVQQTIVQNLAGLECLSGIPGRVGAAPIQNIGAYGQDVSRVIKTVHAIDRATLQPYSFTNQSCEFGYRTSRFKEPDSNRFIVTGVTFNLTPKGPAAVNYPSLSAALEASGASLTIQSVREQVLQLRRTKSMVINPTDPNTRSCGSFFENPIVSDVELQHIIKAAGISETAVPHFPSGRQHKIPAAWLIEQAGFTKGLAQDGVGISTNHNLALINIDGTTINLLKLADQIKQAVNAKFSLQLSIEPIIVP